jgi:high-affinity iron transporter
VHEFQELGLLPTLNEHVWDLAILDPSVSTTGRFLGSLLGWTPRPSLLMAIAYTAYLVPVLVIFLRMTAKEIRHPGSDRTRDAGKVLAGQSSLGESGELGESGDAVSPSSPS